MERKRSGFLRHAIAEGELLPDLERRRADGIRRIWFSQSIALGIEFMPNKHWSTSPRNGQ